MYRLEPNRAEQRPGEAFAVSDHELAVRLSYFLWSSMPDEELLDLADRRQLSLTGAAVEPMKFQGKAIAGPGAARREGNNLDVRDRTSGTVLEQQVRRMLADPRAKSLTDTFAVRWLQINKLPTARPSTEFFPEFNANVRQAMLDETSMFYDSLRRDDRSLLELLDADFTFVNEELARYYGLSAVTGKEMRRVSLKPDDHRGGLLGMGSVLALTSHTSRTSPTQDAGYVNYLRGIGFGEDQFLGLGGDPGAVGNSRPFVSRSAAGRSWDDPMPVEVTQSLLPASTEIISAKLPPPASSKNMLRRFAYGNKLYVAVGDRGRRSVSRDAKQWTDVPNVKAIDTLIDVAFGDGMFVGVGLHGLRMSSPDGVTWSERLLGEEGEHINSVVWTGDRFVGVGQGATYFSADGLKWERKPNSNAPLFAVFGDGAFVGSNWRGRLLRSTDAVGWNDVFQAEHHLEAIAFGPPHGTLG